ncbi:MAG: hypothetical protein ISR58_12180 [Anaerolineales bacterium]|nr:hypothetical protein [Chloroflexota bacterium]MBL6981935.1 hypothetical protein [Anaerolineales bacterium]
MGTWIDAKTQAGKPIKVGDLEIVPLVRHLRMQPPDFRGTLLWGTPKAVIVKDSHGTQEILPIRDVTRRAQMLLLGFGFLGSLLIWLSLRARKN